MLIFSGEVILLRIVAKKQVYFLKINRIKSFLLMYFIVIIIGWIFAELYYIRIYIKYQKYTIEYKSCCKYIYNPEKIRQAILSDFRRNTAPALKKVYWNKEGRKFWNIYEKPEGKNLNILAFSETSMITNKDIYQIRKTLRKFRRSKQEQDPGMKEIYGVFWFDVKDISWGMENKLFELAKVLKKDYILIAVYNRKEQKVKLMPPFLHSKQKYKYVRMRRALSDIVEVVEENEEV